ncbi:hypothetical protein L9F63_014752, partial [Diploptera punctata]
NYKRNDKNKRVCEIKRINTSKSLNNKLVKFCVFLQLFLYIRIYPISTFPFNVTSRQ